MIPVVPAPKPANFDVDVKIPGNNWLQNHPNAKSSEFEPYWRNCISELADAYGHVCAYLAIYFERVLGADSVDHFVPKSDPTRGRQLAYEWDNYRLCCIGENRRKNRGLSPIDPFTMQPQSFFIDFKDGRIYPNPALPQSYQDDCDEAIRVLKLDEPECREMRKNFFSDYAKGDVSPAYMQRRAPFVWQEICRQGLR